MTGPSPRRSRCAVATVFFVNGVMIASWVPHVPGRARGVHAGTALAAVATTGYFGFLVGPPLIGLAAEFVGLPVALGIVSGCCGLVALGAGVIGPTEAPA